MLRFPNKYRDDLENAQLIYETIESSHRGLGKLVLFEVLSDIANRCVLVVGCSGTGKSRVTDLLYGRVKRSKLKIDAITVSGLKRFNKILSYNDMTIVVDDLSKGQTEWSQMATVSVFSSLCYTGSIVKITGNLEIMIQGFRGSAIINLQPLLLRKIARLPEFETDIRDKTIRYYHLRFPVEENINPLPFPNNLEWGYLDDFNLPIKENNKRLYNMAFENFRYEFSKARAREHLNAYLNASAKLNNRAEITRADLWLIYQLSKNFRLEHNVLVKKDLEGARQLDRNVLPILSAIATYRAPRVKDLCFRFGIKKTRLYEILTDVTDYALLVKNKGVVIPTDTTREILKESGEW